LAEKNKFIAYIDRNGTIWKDGTGKDDIEVGLDMSAVSIIRKDIDDLSQKATKYLEELYLCYEGKFKGRPRPKTAEQVAQDQIQINETILSAIHKLQADIESLKDKKGALDII
jgi:citrate synthase